MAGDWRKLHNEELHNLYTSRNIIRVIKSRRMRLTDHVARMKDMVGKCVENFNRETWREERAFDGRIILKHVKG
jgi:hypothetical protein